MLSGTKTEVTLHEPVIYSPKQDHVYRLVNPDIPHLVTTVTFEGDQVGDCVLYDAESNNYVTNKRKSKFIQISDTVFLTQESFAANLPKLPLHIYRIDGNLYFPKEINVTFSNNNVSVQIHLNQYTGIIVITDNKKVHDECKQELKETEVLMGNYPISIGVNPSFDTYNQLFQQFLAFNPDDKLEHQYKVSKGRCHMRAHFFNELLSLYGMNSFKIFKRWNPTDWSAFTDNKSWSYHCATMVIDDQNRKWVWDPWVGLNHKFLSLNEWVFRQDEPKPINVLISSRVVVNSTTDGHIAYGSSFKSHPRAHSKPFQAVFGDAIPNPPKLNQHCFFERSSKAIIKYEDPLAVIAKSMAKK